MHRRQVLAALGAGAALAAVPPRVAGEPKKAQVNDVSLVQLIAAPEKFDGKTVRVHGYVRIEHEGTAVYLHRDDCEHMLTKNGLWLAVNDGVGPGSREEAVNNRYAIIEGRFEAGKKGHMGLWSGSLVDVSRLEPWEVRKAKR
jgi:hypothetical protein